MTTYHDLSQISDSSYKLAELINGGHYRNIFYYEFHEKVDPNKIYKYLEGLIEFQHRSEDYYKIFIKDFILDEEPAIIHIALKVGDELFISYQSGTNYYLGYGPSGILKLRQACSLNNITAFASDENFDNWLKKYHSKSRTIQNNDEQNQEKKQFDDICRTLQDLTLSFQRQPQEFKGLNEVNIRDRMLTILNVIFKNRVNGESKSRKGKTDILIKTKNGQNEHIFELKVWKGIDSFQNAIEQLRGYINWQNNCCGIILFNYRVNYSDTLLKIETFLNENYILEKRNYKLLNEFRFYLVHQTDKKKKCLCHLCCINLKD